MCVVGRVFDEGGEDYSLFTSWSEVVVVVGPVVSQIPDIDGVKEKGVGDVRDVADRGVRRLILLITIISISPVIINLAIFIVVFFDDRYGATT